MLLKWQIRVLRGLNSVKDWFIAQFAFLLLKFLRLFPFEKSARIVEAGARFIGPKIPRHRIGLENLRLAFPEKSEAELEQIARDCWAQLARTAFEYVHLDRLFDLNEEYPEAGRIEVRNGGQFDKLRDDGLPAILFT
ncbi:MAG: hypothetical protein K8F25_12620, partial [Fimbriimonadaceae bacterium]|nr:hypothetical protein [Alphaproteobacteria bacterium]